MDIGQYVRGNSYTDKMFISMGGAADVLAHMDSAALREYQRHLRPSIRARLRKVALMRALAAGPGALFLIMISSSVTHAVQHNQWVLPTLALLCALVIARMAYRTWFGAEVDEHLGVIRIGQSQLHQIGALLDGRGEGVAQRHIVRDWLASGKSDGGRNPQTEISKDNGR